MVKPRFYDTNQDFRAQTEILRYKPRFWGTNRGFRIQTDIVDYKSTFDCTIQDSMV